MKEPLYREPEELKEGLPAEKLLARYLADQAHVFEIRNEIWGIWATIFSLWHFFPFLCHQGRLASSFFSITEAIWKKGIMQAFYISNKFFPSLQWRKTFNFLAKKGNKRKNILSGLVVATLTWQKCPTGYGCVAVSKTSRLACDCEIRIPWNGRAWVNAG
jgi:hypothetical protein